MKNSPRKTSLRHVLLSWLPMVSLALAAAACVAVVTGWFPFRQERRLDTAAVHPSDKRIPDPRFLRPEPPKIPAISKPEAKRMVADLQNAYPHGDAARQASVAAIFPQATGDSLPQPGTLSISLQQALATLPDDDYVTAALPRVANPETPAALMDVLYADLAKRPDRIRLRALFVIAGIESHPLAANALGDLQSILNTDFQQDWSRWDQAISQQLVPEPAVAPPP